MRSSVLVACPALLIGCARSPVPDARDAVGTLEYREVAIAPLTLARVERIAVDEGTPVRVGDTLVVLRQPTMDASLRQGEARSRASAASLRDLEAGARPAEIARAEAELRAAEADAARTQTDLARLEPLAAQGTVSQAQRDAARAAAQASAA
nr:biotin/lipoyl-binding protein [Gemmatimonadaceae bacterium]